MKPAGGPIYLNKVLRYFDWVRWFGLFQGRPAPASSGRRYAACRVVCHMTVASLGPLRGPRSTTANLFASLRAAGAVFASLRTAGVVFASLRAAGGVCPFGWMPLAKQDYPLEIAKIHK
jgi:hypothetical protein